MRKPTRPLARRIDERQPAPYQQSSPEPVFCNEHERCQGCPYPRHGIVCWHRDGTCLRTDTPQFTKQLDVTIAESDGGTVTSSDTLTSLAPGAQVTLTAAPNEGYGVLGWNVTDVDGNATSDYTLKMANDTATITLGNITVIHLLPRLKKRPKITLGMISR